MKGLSRVFLLVGLLLAAPLAHAAEVKVGDLVLSDAWSRAMPKGATTAAGYLTIANQGQTADKLVSVATPVAAKAEVHEMSMTGGVMRMRPVAGGLTIEPGKTVTLQPSGYHLMLTGVKTPLKQGDKVAATLTFEKAGPAQVEFEVLGVGAPGPAGGDHGHMGSMDHMSH